jgi:2-iminobutanoate/2-iminopropanoate deaminase
MPKSYPLEEGQKTMKLPLRLYTRVGDQIFVAGHGAVNEKGEFVSDTFEGQFRYTMETLRKTLQDAGVDFENVAMVRGYVNDPANLPLYNRLYREYFSEPYPARTTLTNCLPPGLEFEIDCVAVVGEKV